MIRITLTSNGVRETGRQPIFRIKVWAKGVFEVKVVTVFIGIIALVLITSLLSCSRSNQPGAIAPVVTQTPTTTPTPTSTPAPTATLSPTSTPIIDSDKDGFNDWFETNIAKTDPNTPNDRYVIVFHYIADDGEGVNFDDATQEESDFLTKKGKIPAENIVGLSNETTATKENLEKAIDQVAAKSDANDLVLLQISCHGYQIARIADSTSMIEGFELINQWLNKITAKAIIITVAACGADEFDYPLKEGSCPRIVYTWIDTSMFAYALGWTPAYSEAADSRAIDSNANGYSSMTEISDWLLERYCRRDPAWRELISLSDTSNIASQTYFTDVTYK